MVFIRIIIARCTTDLILSKYFKTTFLPITLILGILFIIYLLPIYFTLNTLICIVIGETIILLYAYFVLPKVARLQLRNRIETMFKVIIKSIFIQLVSFVYLPHAILYGMLPEHKT